MRYCALGLWLFIAVYVWLLWVGLRFNLLLIVLICDGFTLVLLVWHLFNVRELDSGLFWVARWFVDLMLSLIGVALS